ncbi:MAG: hypothetical protein AAF694_22765 [Bacteroidota bacterium]
MNPNEIDRIYQETFQEYTPEVSETAWEALQPKLKPRPRWPWLLGILFLIPILLLGIGALIYSGKQNGATLGAEQIESVPPPGSVTSPQIKRGTEIDSKPAHFPTESSKRKVRGSLGKGISQGYGLTGIQLNQHTTSVHTQIGQSPLSFSLSSPYPLSPISNLQEDTISHIHPMALPYVKSKNFGGKGRRIGVFGEFIPFGAYQHLHPIQTDDVLLTFPELYPFLSVNRLGIQARFGIEKRLGPKVNVQLGVSGTYLDISIPYTRSFFESYQLSSGISLLEGIRLNPVFSTQGGNLAELQLLDLGLIARAQYSLTDRISLNGGLSYNWPLGKRILSFGEDEYVQTGAVTYLHVGGKYILARFQGSYLGLTPQVSYSLAPWQFSGAPVGIRPYQIGMGITYGLP